MNLTERIRTALERNARALELRPGFGRGTAVTAVQALEGLHCEVTEGTWRFAVDLSEKSGGTNAGPNPGILGRAALGSCLAIGYLMWAARRGTKIDALRVEVETDYDSRGMYGVGGVRPGYEAIRYIVHVESPEPEEALMAVLDEADAKSDFLHVFREPQKVTREVRLRARTAA